MTIKFAQELNEVIEEYNAEIIDEELHLDWWEIIDEIDDIKNEKEIASVIFDIKNMIIFARLTK